MSKVKYKTLDLHGYKAEEVESAVDLFLMKSQKEEKVCIMTGKGLGIVQKKVVDYLKMAGYPWQYLTDENGKPNSGCLLIFMN